MTGAEDTSSPLVSVVIPTHYRNDHLNQALQSVLNQTYDPIEIIVVDDSGESHAATVVDAYPDISYIAHERNQGAQIARTNGIRRARGKYVNLLDDDDRMQENKLEKQVALIESNSDIGVVYCGKQWESGHPVLPDSDVRGNVLQHALEFQMTPSSPSAMLIERALLEEILPLADRPGADDLGMKIELARRTDFDFVDEPLLIQGHAEESRGGSMGAVIGRRQILDEYSDLYDEFPAKVRKNAVGHTYLLEAEIILTSEGWSPRAIRSAMLALYHVPGVPLSFAGYAAASLFGRRGRRVGWKVYDRFLLGDEHRGGLT